ncbi:MAG TPA: O-antigen ligase family protein [Puia sp.]|nr:O-antigen ligase family protein [Puia sp.]
MPLLLKKNIHTWLYWSTCSIALIPILSNALSSISMMVWAALLLLSLIVTDDRKKHAATRNKGLFLLIGGNFIFMALSLLYSNDIPRGSSLLTTSLPMFLFPLGFFVIGFPIEERSALFEKVLTIFWLSTVVMTFWIIGNYWKMDLLVEIGRASNMNTILRETAEQLTDKHPDYLSIYLVFAIYIAGSRFIHRPGITQRIIYGSSALLLLFMLLLLAARSPILALVIGSMVISFLLIKKPAVRWIASLTLLGAFLLAIRLTPAIWSRVMEVRNTPFATPVGHQYNSTNLRIGIYRCSWSLIKGHMWAGVGAGSENKLLMDCYSQLPTDAYQKTFYNTHNQYVNFWLLSGIFSLLLFIASLIYAYRLSLRWKDHAMLFFLILMTIAFASENVLSRQAGVVFYYFFLCLMIARARDPIAPHPLHAGILAEDEQMPFRLRRNSFLFHTSRNK